MRRHQHMYTIKSIICLWNMWNQIRMKIYSALFLIITKNLHYYSLDKRRHLCPNAHSNIYKLYQLSVMLPLSQYFFLFQGISVIGLMQIKYLSCVQIFCKIIAKKKHSISQMFQMLKQVEVVRYHFHYYGYNCLCIFILLFRMFGMKYMFR